MVLDKLCGVKRIKTVALQELYLLDGGGAAPLLHHGDLGGADRPLGLLLGGRLVPGKGPHALPVVAEAQDGDDGGGAAADLRASGCKQEDHRWKRRHQELRLAAAGQPQDVDDLGHRGVPLAGGQGRLLHHVQSGDSHLPGAEDEEAGGEEGHEGGRQDDQLPLVKVGGLLQLLHDKGI